MTVDSGALLNLFRSEMADEATPPLWTDTDIYSYMDEAQKMLCRLTGGIADSTSPLTSLTVAVGATDLNRDERILKVRGAYRESDGQEIGIVNYEDIRKAGIKLDGTSGPLKAIIIGMDDRKFIPYMIPDADDVLRLILDRLPLKEITDDCQKLEVESHHHRPLLLWMKKCAYDKQDAETFNKTKSVEFEGKFIAYCEKARREKDRAKHKTRVVQYGGLPMSNLQSDDYRR